jgi:hypothetical protein
MNKWDPKMLLTEGTSCYKETQAHEVEASQDCSINY